MGIFYQTIAVSVMNLKNCRTRLAASLVVIIGIGGVVSVLIALLAMAAGFENTLISSGYEDRALILREGSTSEMNGNITIEQSNIMQSMPGIREVEGRPLITEETYISINVDKRNNAGEAYLTFRGVSAESFQVRPEVVVTQGRKIEFGKYEIMVGSGAENQFKGFEIGEMINIKGTQWLIVGVFNAQQSAYQSEIWADKDMVNSVFQRGITSLLIQLESSQFFDELSAAVAGDRRLNLNVMRESDYYQAQSRGTPQLIKSLAGVIIGIMALGAIFAALNTMYSAVAARSVEIATLRALGFSSTAVVVSVLIEALCLALIGGSIGAFLTYFIFNGYTVSTIGANSTQVAFAFQVSIELLVFGIILALVLGIIGGLIPALRSVRRSITTELRE